MYINDLNDLLKSSNSHAHVPVDPQLTLLYRSCVATHAPRHTHTRTLPSTLAHPQLAQAIFKPGKDLVMFMMIVPNSLAVPAGRALLAKYLEAARSTCVEAVMEVKVGGCGCGFMGVSAGVRVGVGVGVGVSVDVEHACVWMCSHGASVHLKSCLCLDVLTWCMRTLTVMFSV